MANCRLCNAPIFFLSEKPSRFNRSPKLLPIDVNPDPEGSIAIYQAPDPFVVPNLVREFTGQRGQYVARLYGYAKSSYVALGGVMYRIHFDVCPGRK